MTELDDLFAKGRAKRPNPSSAFMTSTMQDVVAVQGLVKTPTVLAAKPVKISLLDRLFGLFGGLTLGYLQPESLVNLTDTLPGSSILTLSIDLMPAYDILLTED